ncbi:hypothetical protein MRX96_003304 [Rhipicephalus microplus]
MGFSQNDLQNVEEYGEAMAEKKDVDMPSGPSTKAQPDRMEDLLSELPAELFEVSFMLPDERQPTTADDPWPPPAPQPRKP